MANDFFGGLGGLMKGLSGFMPQDDPAVKLMNAQTEVNELKEQEEALYAEIGRKAIQMFGLDTFGEMADRLKLIQANLQAAEAKLKAKEKWAQVKAVAAEKSAKLAESAKAEYEKLKAAVAAKTSAPKPAEKK